MKLAKRRTETYILTALHKLDPVTVYVTNYELGKGKIVIECFGDAWAFYWGAMGPNTLQEFFIGADNSYLLGKFLSETEQTDFDEINEIAHKRGFEDLCVSNEVELAMAANEMAECFGEDWYMDLPRRSTDEYQYLSRIVNAIKGAFSNELATA